MSAPPAAWADARWRARSPSAGTRCCLLGRDATELALRARPGGAGRGGPVGHPPLDLGGPRLRRALDAADAALGGFDALVATGGALRPPGGRWPRIPSASAAAPRELHRHRVLCQQAAERLAARGGGTSARSARWRATGPGRAIISTAPPRRGSRPSSRGWAWPIADRGVRVVSSSRASCDRDDRGPARSAVRGRAGRGGRRGAAPPSTPAAPWLRPRHLAPDHAVIRRSRARSCVACSSSCRKGSYAEDLAGPQAARTASSHVEQMPLAMEALHRHRRCAPGRHDDAIRRVFAFRVAPPGYVLDWHCPCGGSTRSLSPVRRRSRWARAPGPRWGRAFFHRRGHVTRAVGTTPRFYAIVPPRHRHPRQGFSGGRDRHAAHAGLLQGLRNEAGGLRSPR